MTVTSRNKGNETQFSGEVRIAHKTFLYLLEFRVPLSQYTRAGQGKTIRELRKLVDITLMFAGSTLELTDHEWEIFYYAVVPPAIQIYNLRASHKATAAQTAPAIQTAGGDIALKPEACKLLAQPKFGCQFLTEELGKDKPH